MKHLDSKLRQLALFVALTSFFAATAATITSFPYTETNYKSNGWKKYDGKGSWTISKDNCMSSIGSGVSNAWLFSPEISVAEASKYTFTVEVETLLDNFPKSIVEFYILDKASSSANQLKVFDTRVTLSASEMKKTVSLEYEPEQAGTVYFAILDKTNGSDKGWKTQINAFSITEETLMRAPKAVTGLAYATSGDDGTTVSLTWTNPELDTFGDPLQIKHIRLDVNGEQYAILNAAAFTAAGAAVTYTDPVPRSGILTYGVTVVSEIDGQDTDSKTVSVTTGYVGPFLGLDVPMELPFKNSPYNVNWTITAGEDASTWTIDETNDCMKVAVGTAQPIDGTATSPSFRLSADKAYRFSFTLASTNPSNEIDYSLELVGNQVQTLDEMHKIANKTETLTFDFSPAETGLLSFRWHATAEKMTASYYNNEVSVSGISIVELPVLPTKATGLAAVTEGKNVTLTWANPAVSPTGIALTGLKATIMRDGTAISTVDVVAGEQSTFTDTPTGNGYFTYSVQISNANGTAAETPDAVTADYIGDPLTIPFTADFVHASNQWFPTEVGEKANGNKFTFHDTNNWAFVAETLTNFADVLASAPVSLKAGRTYKATAKCAMSSSSRDAQVLLLKTISDLATEDAPVLIGEETVYSSDTEVGGEFSVAEDGLYILAVRVVPASSSWDSNTKTFYIKGFTAEESATVPAAPTDFTAESHPYDEQSVTLSMTLPAKSTRGGDLNARLTAKIYAGKEPGDAEPLATLEGNPGETVQWRHAEAAEGLNTYCATVTLPDTDVHGAGGVSEVVTATSGWCGKAYPTPFESNFADADHRALWTVADQSGQSTSRILEWDETAGAFVTKNSSTSSTNNYFEDWLITPPLYILNEATYTISMEVKSYGGTSSSNKAPSYAIFIGDTNTPAGMVNKGTEIARKVQLNQEEAYATYTHEFSYTPAEQPAQVSARAADYSRPSKKFIAFRFGEKYTTAYPYAEVRSIKVQTNIPTGVEAVATGDEDVTVSYDGLALTASRDDATIEVYSMAGTLVASGRGTVATDALADGVYIVRCGEATLKFAK